MDGLSGKLKQYLHPSFFLHTYLLLLFFLLYRYSQGFFFIRPAEVAVTMLVLLVIVFLVNLLFKKIFAGREANGAVWVTFFFMTSLFFTSVVNFLQQAGIVNDIQWNRKTIIILVIFWVLLFILLYLLKKPAGKFCNYLNVLFCILILYQVYVLVTAVWSSKGQQDKIAFYERSNISPAGAGIAGDSLPDIYFIIFDGYTGNKTLREIWNFDNSSVTDSLREKGFFVSDNAVSAYNYTPVCISSLLNMSQRPDWFKELGTYWGLSYYLREIKANALVRTLQNYQYKIVNFSFFELADQPAFTSFKPLSTSRNFYRFVLENSVLLRFFTNPVDAAQGKNNLKLYESLQDTIKKDTARKFVYTHLMMPHPAFFFDSSGRYYANGKGKYRDEKLNYIEQLKYSNRLILSIADSVKHYRPNSVVIIQGDHGSRLLKTPDGKMREDETYHPFSAIYFPDRNYRKLSDSLFTPNTFRIVLNEFFKTGLDLLKSNPKRHIRPVVQ
jgi:hypothetical protein